MTFEDLNLERYYTYINAIISSRGQWAAPEDGIWENHHIIPACMGGEPAVYKNDTIHNNLVWLTPEEHYEAHKILAEDNPTIQSLFYGWHMMAFPKGDTKRQYMITAEDYGILRRQQSKFMHKLHLGKKASELTRQKMSAAQRGKRHIIKDPIKYAELSSLKAKNSKWYNNGIIERTFMPDAVIPAGFQPGRLPFTEETKQNLSKCKIGIIYTEDRNKKISEALLGKPKSESHCKHISEGLTGLRQGMHWYNNGIESKQFFDKDVPSGWHKGRLSLGHWLVDSEGNTIFATVDEEVNNLLSSGYIIGRKFHK